MSSAPSVSPERLVSTRKSPRIWALAGITYGAVIGVALLSVLAYYYLAPKRTTAQQLTDASRSMAVGSVWLPVYPGGTVEGASSTKEGNVAESTVTFASKDQAGRVLAFYQAALKRGVFRFSTVTRNADGGIVRSMAHDGKTTVMVTVRSAEGGSRGELRTVDRDLDDKAKRN